MNISSQIWRKGQLILLKKMHDVTRILIDDVVASFFVINQNTLLNKLLSCRWFFKSPTMTLMWRHTIPFLFHSLVQIYFRIFFSWIMSLLWFHFRYEAVATVLPSWRNIMGWIKPRDWLLVFQLSYHSFDLLPVSFTDVTPTCIDMLMYHVMFLCINESNCLYRCCR